MNNKIIRTICYFTDNPSEKTLSLIEKISKPLLEKGFEIQTKRVCSSSIEKIKQLDAKFSNGVFIFSVGTLEKKQIEDKLDSLLNANDVSFNLDLTSSLINEADVQILFKIIKDKPGKTFNFTYVFNNKPQTPFFPSASWVKNGFSIGLQPTDLAENCKTLEEWLNEMKQVWEEIYEMFKDKESFLGIDSSIAPFSIGKGSLVNFVKKLGFDFSRSTTTDVYLRITKFMESNNPRPVGLCGLMFPCLEDFELADEYEQGNFSIERNVYLSLHSGVGIDTYPIGVNESSKKVLDTLRLIQGLSNKYKKPLSVRFVSDDKAKIGEKTDFENQYLKDVIVKAL